MLFNFNIFIIFLHYSYTHSINFNGDYMKLFDTHNDLLTQKNNFNQILKTFPKQGLNKVVLAIFLSEKNLETLEIVKLVENVKLKKDIYFAIEDISAIPYSEIDRLKEIRPLYCSLTWNYKNKLAGGSFSSTDITKLGYRYIDKIESFSHIDTAHLNKKSFRSLSKYTKKPLFNSHTNLTKIHRHKRNLTNKQIKTIIKSNGLVCLCGVKEFLGKESNLDTYIKSIYYFYKKFGANNLALSSDFLGSDEFPLVYKNYNDFKKIYTKLKEKGISASELEKIFYSNVIKFFNL